MESIPQIEESTKNLQVKIPEYVSRGLKSDAGKRGQTIQDWVLEAIRDRLAKLNPDWESELPASEG